VECENEHIIYVVSLKDVYVSLVAVVVGWGRIGSESMGLDGMCERLRGFENSRCLCVCIDVARQNVDIYLE